MAGLGLGPSGREARRGTRLVGDHADQAAGLKAQAQLDAPATGIARGFPRGGGGSVPYRVSGKLGGDDDGILDQCVQMPRAQRRDGELTCGPGGLRYGRQPDAAAPPRCGGRGCGRLPGAVAIVCGVSGSRLTSLVHGWTTEPEVGRVRHRSAHQLRCHFGCADASALAQEADGTRDHARRNGARGIASFNSHTPERHPVGWHPAAERDEPWIWCPATCCLHSCGPRNGARVVTAIPAVTAWKWPGCPESRWPCATPTARMDLRCYLPGPPGSASCAACVRVLPS